MIRVDVINPSKPLWLEILQKLHHDIYHLPQYLELEAKRINATAESMVIREGESILFFPYLLRQCNSLFDYNIAAQ